MHRNHSPFCQSFISRKSVKEMYLSCLDYPVYLSVKLGRLPLNSNKKITNIQKEKENLFNYKENAYS